MRKGRFLPATAFPSKRPPAPPFNYLIKIFGFCRTIPGASRLFQRFILEFSFLLGVLEEEAGVVSLFSRPTDFNFFSDSKVMSEILVVDDSRFHRKIHYKLVEGLGHAPVGASSGQEALDLAERINPACITSDLGLGDMTGFQVLERFNEKGITAPVIVITADIQNSSREKCMALGALAVLEKPVDGANFREWVGKWLTGNGEAPLQ